MTAVFRKTALAVVAIALAVLLPQARAAGSEAGKVALVIGNQRYSGDNALPNAANDARLMARTLNTLGFSVTERHDLDRGQFAAAVTEFADRVPAGSTALVYYAGHGMQIGGSSYLNPVDMQVTSEQGTPARAYSVTSLLERLSRTKSAVNIVVLDACRNNPFRPMSNVRFRSFRDLGLSRIEAPRGTLIAYSTAPGQLAPDGKGANSLYTETLARALLEPGREIEEVFKRVGNEVRRKTSDDQIPWYESSLVGKYTMKPLDGAVAASNVSRVPDVAASKALPDKESHRGMRATAAEDSVWYRQLAASDWSRIDWEIQQRIRRLTPEEIPALEHKASGGSVIAQTVVGLAYRDGVDKAIDTGSGRITRFKANNTKAWQWLKKAAQAGFPVAQAEVGEMYYAGHGTDRDLQASRHWLELAATASYPRAKLDLLQLGMETSPGSVDMQDAMNSIIESLRAAPPQTAPRR